MTAKNTLSNSNHFESTTPLLKELIITFINIVDLLIDKCLIVCIFLTYTCIILFIICILIHIICYVKKQNSLRVTINVNNNQLNQLDRVSSSTASKMGFKALPNTSQLNNDNINIDDKDNEGLNELHIQNEKHENHNSNTIDLLSNINPMQENNNDNEIGDTNKNTKRKKSRKINSNRNNTGGNKEEDVFTPNNNVYLDDGLGKVI